MSNDEKMSIEERRKYLKKMQKRYRKARRGEKGKLLDEMIEVTGMHRKSLTRLMGGELARKPRRKQRGRTYGPEVGSALAIIAESLADVIRLHRNAHARRLLEEACHLVLRVGNIPEVLARFTLTPAA